MPTRHGDYFTPNLIVPRCRYSRNSAPVLEDKLAFGLMMYTGRILEMKLTFAPATNGLDVGTKTDKTSLFSDAAPIYGR